MVRRRRQVSWSPGCPATANSLLWSQQLATHSSERQSLGHDMQLQAPPVLASLAPSVQFFLPPAALVVPQEAFLVYRAPVLVPTTAVLAPLTALTLPRTALSAPDSAYTSAFLAPLTTFSLPPPTAIGALNFAFTSATGDQNSGLFPTLLSNADKRDASGAPTTFPVIHGDADTAATADSASYTHGDSGDHAGAVAAHVQRADTTASLPVGLLNVRDDQAQGCLQQSQVNPIVNVENQSAIKMVPERTLECGLVRRVRCERGSTGAQSSPSVLDAISDSPGERSFSSKEGLEVSSSQLDQLWKLDFQLASSLLKLPQRKCFAVPNEEWGRPMEPAAFSDFLEEVSRMWFRAALCFEPYLDPALGWGLRVRRSLPDKLSITPTSNMKEMGWIAKAPLQSECPTSHRYLRSPISCRSYLGGPISLMNWASTKESSVKCYGSINSSFNGKYMLQTVKPLAPLTPVQWNYGFLGDLTFPECMPNESAWKTAACCS